MTTIKLNAGTFHAAVSAALLAADDARMTYRPTAFAANQARIEIARAVDQTGTFTASGAFVHVVGTNGCMLFTDRVNASIDSGDIPADGFAFSFDKAVFSAAWNQLKAAAGAAGLKAKAFAAANLLLSFDFKPDAFPVTLSVPGASVTLQASPTAHDGRRYVEWRRPWNASLPEARFSDMSTNLSAAPLYAINPGFFAVVGAIGKTLGADCATVVTPADRHGCARIIFNPLAQLLLCPMQPPESAKDWGASVADLISVKTLPAV